MGIGDARRALARAAVATCALSAGAQLAAVGAARAQAAAEDEAVQLDEIEVIGRMFAGWQGASDAVYDTPGSVAQIGREKIEAQGGARNAADLFRGVAGVDAVIDRQNPGLNVNIRGLQDQGRVNMTVDGARQNFQQSGHGSTSLAYLDPELLARVDIEKGPTSGVGGAGVIGGVVNFRTLEFEDIATGTKDWGARVNATTGTNAFDFNGSLTAAAKVSDAFDVVAAVGRKSLGEYDVGERKISRLQQTPQENQELAEFTTQDQWSWLLKARADVSDTQRVKLTYTGLDAKFGTGSGQNIDTDKVTAHNLIADYAWTPGNDWVDLAAKLTYTRTENAQFRPERLNGSAVTPAARVDYATDTFGGSLANTSRFSASVFDVALTYGAEAFFDKTDTKGGFLDPDFDPTNTQFSGSNPIGERGVGGVFANAELKRGDRLQILLGGRYDRYELTGDTLKFDNRGATSVPVHVDMSEGRFSPTATVAVTPLAGAQLYASYKQGFRPPNLMEAVIGGQHIGGRLFSDPNPNLKPEISETWEAGLNLKYDGVLAEGDAFRAKFSVYTTDVRNFITLATYFGVLRNMAVNLKDETRLKGFDAEANYDAGSYYVGGAASFLDARYGDDYDAPGLPTFLLNIYLPPKRKLSLDGGLRFLDRKLTVGGRVTALVPEDNIGLFGGSYEYSRYTLLDVYASYKLTEDFTVRAAVENIRDVAYVDAMGSGLSPSPGRTFTVGATARF